MLELPNVKLIKGTVNYIIYEQYNKKFYVYNNKLISFKEFKLKKFLKIKFNGV